MGKFNKITIIFLSFLLCLLSIQLLASAEEKTVKKFFGVGAAIEEISPGEYEVTTKGKKEAEGFVFTPNTVNLDKNIKFQVDLKGKGQVYLKIEETDARGRFVKESRSEDIHLTDTWITKDLEFELENETSQLDVFVLTSNNVETEFHFKNLQVTSR